MSFKETDDWREALTWMILPVGRAWQKAAGVALARTGQSLSSAATILLVARLGDGVKQKDVAEEAVLDPAAIARSILQLEAEGLVTRRTDTQDTRAKILSLTPAGHALAVELDAILMDLRKAVFGSVSEEDGKAAVQALLALEAACGKDAQTAS
jgi:MarR family transcriptional regulator, transcriptional regulator for hemolysin